MNQPFTLYTKMELGRINEIWLGKTPVKEIWLGNRRLWGGGKYLEIAPEVVWLQLSNDFQADVQVYSDTKWDVE